MNWYLAPTLLFTVTTLLSAQPPDLPRPPGPGGFPGSGLGTPNSLSQQYKDLIPSLIEALKDTDQEVRQHTALALAALGQEAIKPLSKALEDPVKEKRAAAAYALGQMGYNGQEAVPALLKA